MEQAKQSKYTVRSGLILAMVWLMVAFFVMSVSAATTGSGKTTNSEFTWSWSTNNTAKEAAGELKGSLTEKTLTLTISANSSIHLDEEKNNCGNVTQEEQDAANTTNTAIITNNTGYTISIEKITATTAICSVLEGALLAHGDTFEVYITAKPNSPEDGETREYNDSVVITYTEVANVNVTYYGADGASYSYEEVVLSDATASVTEQVAVGSTVTLPAAPTVTSGTFAGWRMSHDGSLVAAGATVTINNNTSVYPVIVQEGAAKPFTVNDVAYEYWTDAAKAAGSSGTIILNQNYKLSATMASNGVSPIGSKYVTGADGNVNFIVPSGVTLLIPFDDDNTIYTTNHKNKSGLIEGGTSAATGAYRILTMPDGVNITVNGSINLSAKLNAPGGGKTNAGAPTGEVPYIVMQGNSSITLNSGAYLYCYGFITGSGSVLAKSGATVYECFQIRDYRGGSGSSSIKDVFPSSQYYIQNVEVPITFESGATLKGVSAIYVSRIAVYMNDISVIGSSGSLFANSGTVTKKYNGNIDRLIIDIAGDASLGSVALDFGNLGASIDSAKYVLGLNNNMTVNVNSGTTTAKQALALQPGAILNIAHGAEVVLEKNLYVYDADEWGDYVYCESMTTALGGIEHPAADSMQDGNNWAAVQVAFAPGKQYTRTLDDLVDAQINVNGTLTATTGLLYTTASGASITSSAGTGKVVMIAGTATITKQADMNSGSTLDYYDIPITSAKLKNGDGSYTETSSATSVTTYTYCSDCMGWECKVTAGHIGHATNVELGNSLNMYFAFWSNDIEITDGHKVVISHTDWETQEETTVEFPYEKWQITDIKVSGTTKRQNAYVVYYKGLSAMQMGDVITVKLCTSSGEVVDTWSNSIQHYAMRMLSLHSDNQKLRTLIVDMLNYGAACQTEFQYNAENLVNSWLSKEQQEWATDKVTIENHSTSSNYHDSSNLVLAGNIQYIVAFNDSSKIAKIEYTFANHWKDGDNGLSAGDAVKRDESYYGSGTFSIRYLVVADARQIITIKVYDKDGSPLGNWKDSIESYCARIINNAGATDSQKAVCTAFMKFADSAEAYLEGGNRV